MPFFIIFSYIIFHIYEHIGGQIVTSREVDFSGVNLTEVCFVFRF